MRPWHWLLAGSCMLPLLAATAAYGAGATSIKEAASQAAMQPTSPENGRAVALAWLRTTGKADPATLNKFDAVWAQTGASVLDRVTETILLVNPAAADLLAAAADPGAPAPTAIPALLKDAKTSAFVRANLGLAYAKALVARRIDDEALEVLRLVKPSEVVDPAAYFFNRAVVEHSLLLKEDANRSIVGLLEDVSDAPERYKMLAVLMAYDMQSWQDKDLGDIARKMDKIERRLSISRGGPKTQKLQKEVIARLDEVIKKLENQAKGCGN